MKRLLCLNTDNIDMPEEVEGSEYFYDAALERDQVLSLHWCTQDPDLVGALGLPRSRRGLQEKAYNSILTEAMLAHQERRWVSYSRHKENYSGKVRYHSAAYTYAAVLPAVDHLAALGFIEEQRSSPRQRGWQSRFRATPQLVESWAKAAVGFHAHEVIRLKDAEGQLVNYFDTDATRRMRRELRAINTDLASISLELNSPDVTRTSTHLIVGGAFYRPTAPVLYRVFNRRSFVLGGRAYGWWQSLPKAQRCRLLVNGEPAAEPDFHQMHASMLYAEQGLTLNGDAYEVGDFSRDMAKIAFNVLVNARTKQGSISALRRKSGWSLDGEETSRLINAVIRRHQPIAGAFHADRGVSLMRRDSDITLAAQKACIAAGIPTLPIHDSMLTTRRYEGQVAEIMERSAARNLNMTNPCRVRVFGFKGSTNALLSSSLPVLPSWVGVAGQLSLLPPEEVTFSVQMKQLRLRCGLTQEELAAKIGCGRPHVARLERGRGHLRDWSRRRFYELLQSKAA